MRHSNASWLVETVETMEDVKVISNRLGHSSTQMTLDTYSHVLKSRESSMIGVLGGRKTRKLKIA
jgi:integrase